MVIIIILVTTTKMNIVTTTKVLTMVQDAMVLLNKEEQLQDLDINKQEIQVLGM